MHSLFFLKKNAQMKQSNLRKSKVLLAMLIYTTTDVTDSRIRHSLNVGHSLKVGLSWDDSVHSTRKPATTYRGYTYLISELCPC